MLVVDQRVLLGNQDCFVILKHTAHAHFFEQTETRYQAHKRGQGVFELS